jgi:hypothetical protein
LAAYIDILALFFRRRREKKEQEDHVVNDWRHEGFDAFEYR